MIRLIEGLGFEIVSVTPAFACRVAKSTNAGVSGSPGRTRFGDCFAYDLAKEHACRLLYVGRNFGQTDIESALP